MASCRARLRDRFRSDGQLEPRTVKPRMVAYPFCPSWAAVGEQFTAGYAAFFFSLYRTQLSVIAPTQTAKFIEALVVGVIYVDSCAK